MTNKRLYNIILQNYPDILTRRHSEVAINVENPEGAGEPAKLPVSIMAKKPKDDTETDGKKRSHKDLHKTESNKSGPHHKSESNKALRRMDSNKSDHANKNESTKSNTNINSVKPKEKLSSKPSKPGLPQNMSWFRQISSDHHYLKDMPLYRNTMMHRGAMMSIPSRYKLRASSLPDIYKNSSWSLDSESDEEMVCILLLHDSLVVFLVTEI